MARRPPAFDAAKAELLLSYLQAGAYGHVAAEAAGLATATLQAWLRRGLRKGATEPYRSFARRYVQIKATARLQAEFTIFKKDPKSWLKCGPGKETAASPGWSREAPPSQAASSSTSEDLLAHPVVCNLMQAILEALKPFAEARLAVAATMQSLAEDAKPAPTQLPRRDASAGSEEAYEA
jgi:hypothetical protein